MNMQSIMQQAQKMQRDMEKKQNEIAEMKFTGKSGLIEVVLSGDRIVKTVKIDSQSSLDSEDLEMFEDMIKIAMNDALAQIEKVTQEKMGSIGGSLGGLF